MKTEVHLLTYNEQDILPYTLRHYTTFAQKIIVHDSFSTDRTREIAQSYGAEVRDWDTGGTINDKLAAELKNTAWKGTDADFCIMADADELIYFPQGTEQTLATYLDWGLAFVRPRGFELHSYKFPTTGGQLYDQVKYGAPDDKWYSKPILFQPPLVKDMGFGIGAHGCRAQLVDGSELISSNVPFTDSPPTYLLHCKHLGPVQRITKEYTTDQQRLSEINRRQRWGNQDDPHRHALEKRSGIIARLQRVIA